MSLIATSLPEVLIDDSVSPAIYSRWVAAHNPVVFEFTRKDVIVSSVTVSSGKVQLNLASSHVGSLSVGDQIYVVTEKYVGLTTVHLLPVSTVVVTNMPYTVASSGGYCNYVDDKPNYYINVSIKDADGILIDAIKYTPLLNGVCACDISGILQSLVSNLDAYDFQDVTGQQTPDNICAQFTVTYQEFWKNSTTTTEQSLSGTYYAVNGAFQIRHVNNGNYKDFVIYDQNKTGKFLSPFAVPTAFPEWANTISFIYDPEAIAEPIEVQTFTVYANNPTATPPDFSATSPTALAESASKVNEILYALGPISGNDNRRGVYVWLQRQSDHARISEQRYIRIVPTDKYGCNTIMLRWLAPDGSWAQYLFNSDYRETLQVDLTGTFQTAFDNISQLESFNRVLQKRSYKKLQIGMTGLDQNDAEGIKTLLSSPQVYVLVMEGGFPARIGVTVEPGTFSIRKANASLFDIEFSIVFPENFNQIA